MEIYTLKNVAFSLQEQKILNEITFSVNKGEWVVLFGPSGSGKTTLLKLLKNMLSVGEQEGEISYKGQLLADTSSYTLAKEIGYVSQIPEQQIVMDEVWHELAFGLENLGTPPAIIRTKIAEIANFFGIQHWFHQKTMSLSGGQKQLLNLAAVLVMEPEVLILDEPTSQLDPIAAAEFIGVLNKVHKQLGITIILTEHRLEEVLPLCDRAAYLKEGKIHCIDTPKTLGAKLNDDVMMEALPAATRIFYGLRGDGACALTERDGMLFLQDYEAQSFAQVASQNREPLITLQDICFRYEKDGKDIAKNATLVIEKGEIFSIVGSNGSGKTTLLQIIAGIKIPYKGKIIVDGKKVKGPVEQLRLLPQNPQLLFFKNTVLEDYEAFLAQSGVIASERDMRIQSVVSQLHIEALLKRNPMDLSGGQQQKVAIGKLLLTPTNILLMDEPTKGLDAVAKMELQQILRELQQKGTTIVIVTHDLEFAAAISDRCGMYFDGQLLSASTPREFFSNHSFYTTPASRMARAIQKDLITCEEIITHCQKRREVNSNE